MRFHCTVGESTFAPLKIFGLQGPPEPKIENKFVELKQCLVKTVPLSVEEFRSDLAFGVSMIAASLIMLVGLFITGRALVASVLWLVRLNVQLCKAGIKLENIIQFDSKCPRSISEKTVLQEKKSVVQDIISAHEGLSNQLARVQRIVTKFAKKRRVLANSPVTVISYPGEELEGKNVSHHATKTTSKSPTEEDWARYYEEEMAEQAKLKEMSKEKVSDPFFDFTPWEAEKEHNFSDTLRGMKSINPSHLSNEETFEIRKEVNKRVEELERQILEENLSRIQDGTQHQCSSSTVIGAMRKSTKMRSRINRSVDILATIEEVCEPINMVPFVSGVPPGIGKTLIVDDCYSFDLNPTIVEFVDDFPNDLPLITSEDIADLCQRTPLMTPLTPNETTAVEIWLRSYQAPFSFRAKYPNLWY